MNNQEQRLALYRKIEVGRRQLANMDDVAFRTLLQNEFGKTSRKDMTNSELARLINILASYGAVFVAKKGQKAASKPLGSPRSDFIEITDSMPCAAEKRQILAIWRRLGYSLASLDTRVKRSFGAHCFIWLQNREQISVLLSDLQRREKAFDKKHSQCQAV